MPDARTPRPRLAPENLDALAQVSPSDVDRAVALFKKRCPRGAGLIDAKPITPKEPKP